MIEQRELSAPRHEPPPEFSWLERRADGMVVMLAVTLPLADFAIYWFRLGAGWLLLALAAGVGVGCLLGKQLGDHLGRGYVGGMFLRRWARSLFLCVLLALLVWPGFYLAYSKRSGATTPRGTPAVRSGDRSP